MNPFQIGFATLTVLCLLYFMVLNRRSAVKRLFMVVFFGTGVVFVLWPELSTRLANSVGIGRGVDLVLYLSILFLFVLCFSFLARVQALEARQAVLVQALARLEPVQEERR